jgi:hypothetical protein
MRARRAWAQRLCALLRMPMTYIVTLVLQQWDTKELHIDETTFVTLFENLERGYLFTNPYHNATHAADVACARRAARTAVPGLLPCPPCTASPLRSTHWRRHCRAPLSLVGLLRVFGWADSTHVMLKHGAQEALQVSDLQCAVCIIAAAAHDFRHPGIGADFLIKTGHELALTCTVARDHQRCRRRAPASRLARHGCVAPDVPSRAAPQTDACARHISPLPWPNAHAHNTPDHAHHRQPGLGANAR